MFPGDLLAKAHVCRGIVEEKDRVRAGEVARRIFVGAFRRLGSFCGLELFPGVVIKDELQGVPLIRVASEWGHEISEGFGKLNCSAVTFPGSEHLAAGNRLIEGDFLGSTRIAEETGSHIAEQGVA